MPELLEVDLTGRIIKAAIRLHRTLGPGFLESIYEEAMAIEFESMRIPIERQKSIPIVYQNQKVGEHRLNFFVDSKVVLELKTIESLDNIHYSTVRSYMRAAGVKVGLILNFATMPLTVKRVGPEPQMDECR